MRPRQATGRSWVSRLGRTAFALTTIVVIPLAFTERALAPALPLPRPPRPVLRDIYRSPDFIRPNDLSVPGTFGRPRDLQQPMRFEIWFPQDLPLQFDDPVVIPPH
jgi:hypothetical protein